MSHLIGRGRYRGETYPPHPAASGGGGGGTLARAFGSNAGVVEPGNGDVTNVASCTITPLSTGKLRVTVCANWINDTSDAGSNYETIYLFISPVSGTGTDVDILSNAVVAMSPGTLSPSPEAVQGSVTRVFDWDELPAYMGTAQVFTVGTPVTIFCNMQLGFGRANVGFITAGLLLTVQEVSP